MPAATPFLPLMLGLAGLIPFVATASLAWLAPVAWQVVAVDAFLYYSAIILSFLGGVQWGVAMSQAPADSPGFRLRLLASMAPSLIAWPALLLHPLTGAWVLASGFVLVRLYELTERSRPMLPGWYHAMRMPLTLIVLACHGLLIWRLWGN